MLEVTPKARSQLQNLLTQLLEESDPHPDPELSFRLVIEGTRLGLALDSPRGGDEIVSQGGCSVLILDGSISEFLENLTLDVVETSEGMRLEFRDRK